MTLPAVPEPFHWIDAPWGHALICRALAGVAPHLFSTRQLELSSDTHAAALTASLGALRLVQVNQVHGRVHVVVRAGEPLASGDRPEADILVSNATEAAIAVRAADCVPILIADRRNGAVAAAHAGWRGLAAGVPRVAIDALTREFGSRPADLVAAAGPSIGACCYEVGSEVRQRFEEAGWPASKTSGWFFERAQPTAANPSMAGLRPDPRPGFWYFDSGRAAGDQLESAGVPRDQIFLAGLCTASHPAVLCSYRRDGAGCGRIAGAIRSTSS